MNQMKTMTLISMMNILPMWDEKNKTKLTEMLLVQAMLTPTLMTVMMLKSPLEILSQDHKLTQA